MPSGPFVWLSIQMYRLPSESIQPLGGGSGDGPSPVACHGLISTCHQEQYTLSDNRQYRVSLPSLTARLTHSRRYIK